ncbi:MAG: universal stress protein [Candidatus Melainabacteria bacterium]|nr:universal stress protein [Candidatus Melainabacteria bacterium]
MFKKIAVNFDGTDAGTDLLLTAIRYAHETNAEVHIIAIISDFSSDCYSSINFAHELETLKNESENVIGRVIPVAAEFEVTIYSHVTFGPFPQKLLEVVDEVAPDLLIVGENRKRNLIENFFFNPLTEIVKKCPMSVMVLRAGSSVYQDSSGTKQLATIYSDEHHNPAC